MEKLLSICIPTYNFGAFIGQTLSSILSQVNERVEVVVLDSNSTDNTEEICRDFQSRYPSCALHYFRNQVRRGIDLDIADVVERAQGKYVWLFSADDVMLDGTIEKVLAELESEWDIYLSQHKLCDFHLNPLRDHPIFSAVEPGEVFNFSCQVSRGKYFSAAQTSEAFFSFLSTPIFKKEVWTRVTEVPSEFYTTCWGLAGRLLLSARSGMSVKYLGDTFLKKRGDNDSFLEKGRIHRIGIAVKGFHLLANTIYGRDSEEAFHIRRVIRSEIPFKTILFSKLLAYQRPQVESLSDLEQIVKMHYSDFEFKNYIRKILYFMSNKFALVAAYHANRTIKSTLQFFTRAL